MESLAFNSIGFHAALILNRLRNERRLASHEEQDPTEKPESAPKGNGEKNPSEKREYIERRLAELAEFERRLASGIKGRR